MTGRTQADYLHAARADLLAAIGAATGGAVDEEREDAILRAIDRLVIEAGNEALVAKAEAYTRIQRLIESETGRIDAVETRLRLAAKSAPEGVSPDTPGQEARPSQSEGTRGGGS